MKQLIMVVVMVMTISITIFSMDKNGDQKQLEEIIIGHQMKVFDSGTFSVSDPRHYPSIFQYLFLYDGTFYAFDEAMETHLGIWEIYNLGNGHIGIELVIYETPTIMNVMTGFITNITDTGFTITIKDGLEIEFHRAYYKDNNGLIWMY